MEGLQSGCAWVPATPANPNSTSQKLICTNWQEKNHLVEPNLVGLERCTDMSEPGRLPAELLQQKASACCSSANFVDVNGNSRDWVTNSSAGADDMCTSLLFGKLLALANAGGNTGGSQFNISFANPSSLQYQENQQAQKSGAEFDMLNVLTDGSVLSRPLIDLNAPPMFMDAASSRSELAQFEPITPMKINRDEAPAGGDQPKNKTSRNDGATEHHGKKEKSKLISNLLSVETTRLRDSHKPDNRGIDDEDFIMTPPPKMRRKKHRPKVIIEGQQKRTPKSSAAKSNVSQEVTRFKRKYVRRKGINKVLEGEANLDSSIGKRKCTREKGISIPEGNVDNGAFETSDGGPARYTRSSCRRSLNFNLECHVKDGSSPYYPSFTCNGRLEGKNISTEDQSRTIIAVEKNDRDGTHGQHHATNQELRVSMESSFPSFSMPTNMYPQMYSMLADQILHPRGKCQIVFSDETHDKEIETVHIGMHSEDKRSQESFDDFIFNSMCLTPETRDAAETVEAEVCTKYKTRTLHNFSQSYPSTFSQNADKDNSKFRLNFPKFCKKMRTSKRQQAAKLQYAVTIIGHRAKLERRSATDGTQSEKQVSEDRFIWGSLDRIRKRRSKGRKRLRDLSSLLEIHKETPSSKDRAAKKSRKVRSTEILHEPQRCMKALVAMTTKKRSKRTMPINEAVQYNHQELSTISMGPPLALTWKHMPSVDSITEQLNHLNLDHNLVTEYNAIVPYKSNGDVVAFDNTFDEERRLRPKVDLDDETTRVWKLLLENINSEGIDGIDEENTKMWEDERRVFSGRADSFIARMRLVQGDRHFSPWKGSVLDSVVGVFLTQNVSDHLSSSAFMSLVAQFPVSSNISPSDLYEEVLGSKMKEPEVYDPDPVGNFGTNKETLNHSMHGEDTKMVHEYGSIKEIDPVKSLGNFFNRSSSEDNLSVQPTESSKCIPAMYSEIVANKLESCIEDGRDIESTLSSQKSTDFSIEQATEKSESCTLSSTSEEPTPEAESSKFTSSFEKLLQRAGSILNGGYERDADKKLSDQNWHGQSESSSFNYQNLDHLDNATLHATLVAPNITCHASSLGGETPQYDLSHNISIKSSREKELYAAEISGLSSESMLQVSLKITDDSYLEGPNFSSSNVQSINNDQVEINQMSQEPTQGLLQRKRLETQVSEVPIDPQNSKDVSNLEGSKTSQHKDDNSNSDPDYQIDKTVNRLKARGRPRKGKEKKAKWNQLKTQALTEAGERARTVNTMDSVDWDAVRCTNVNEIAQTIKERGMNNMLAQRIKDFLNRLIRDHGSLDLEWLRDVPPDKAKEYLLSIRGLGLKSVECVRLLTLHHVAFPVDTNVGRIAVRLGWVPLQPLPESLQLHLLEMYPILESIQKYLWPRLCKLDQGTLYELHYQMITFGKVFCTKSKPNCNACPMRGECRHFASAFASARFALPAPEEKGIVSSTENGTAYPNSTRSIHTLLLPPLDTNQIHVQSRAAQPFIEEPPSPEPIIEVPTTPEPAYEQVSESIIKSDFNEELDEIPTIKLNMEEFTHNLQEIMQQNTELHEGDMSKALVALASEAASLPVPKLKNISRLRTEHRVYELPDSHPLLERMDKREPDDPCPYLLAIWTPGETVDSIEPPAKRCKSQGLEKLCTDEICLSCNSIREANSQTVRGTLLIPCRTAMRGSFPLNGTYFQVNEVFSDHESSLSPLDVPRAMLWNLPRRTVFFGTSIPTIFRGLSTEGIQYCFWRGFVCVRGFDRKTRAPRPLVARLHFPASRLGRRKGKPDEEYP